MSESIFNNSVDMGKRLIDNAPFPFVITNLKDNRIIYINALAAKLFRLSLKEAVGKAAPDFYCDVADRDRMLKILFDKGMVSDYEVCMKNSEGEVFWTLISTSLINFDDNKWILSSFSDITKQKNLQEELRQTSEKFIFLTENMRDIIWQMDRDFKFVYVSPSTEGMIGYKPDEVVGRCLSDFLSYESRIAFDIARKKFLEEYQKGIRTNHSQYELQLVDKKGMPKWVEINVNILFDGQGALMCFQGITRDISRRKESEEKIREITTRLSLATNAAHIGIWEWDMDSGFLIWNDEMYYIYNVEKDSFDVTVESWESLIHPGDLEFNSMALRKCFSGEAPYDNEFRIITPQGDAKYIKARGCTYTNMQKGYKRFIGINYDVTDSKIRQMELEEKNKLLEKVNNELHAKSITDGLTGLYNHQHIIEILEREMKRNSKLSIIMYDIDNFKAVNDRMGHQSGDELLVSVAKSIRNSLRDVDSIGRYGGEEFLIVLPGTGKKQCWRIAERIRQSIAKLPADSDGARVTISGGVAEYKGEDAARLIHMADMNLYRAKLNGKNRVEL